MSRVHVSSPSVRWLLVSLLAWLLAACGGGGKTYTAASAQPATPGSPAAPTVLSVTVSPQGSQIVTGGTQQFQAMANLSDGTSRPVTSADWTSSNPSAAQISSSGFAQAASSLSGGKTSDTTTITATDLASGKSGTAFLTVNAASLQSIQISTVPDGQVSLQVGGAVQFKANGAYTDGSSRDVTASVTWGSDSGAVSISNASGSNGLANGVNAGTAKIAASSGTVSSNAVTLTVSASAPPPVTLKSVTISPDPATLHIISGQTTHLQFHATATYSDNSSADVTSSATWSSSDTNRLKFDTRYLGLATALLAGQAPVTVSATYSGMSDTASATIASVTTVDSIRLVPDNSSASSLAPLPVGLTQPFRAIATFNEDGTTQDITTDVQWTAAGQDCSSPAASIAVISNNAGSNGLARANSSNGKAGNCTPPGTATSSVTAAYSVTTTTTTPNPLPLLPPTTTTTTTTTTSAPVTLTVLPAVVQSLQLTPVTPTVPAGSKPQFTATGYYTDGNNKDLTSVVIWSSDNPGVATIDSKGLATTLLQGSTNITATLPANPSKAQPQVDSPTNLLTVSAIALQSIALAPAAPKLAKGTTQQFSATGVYSDGSTQDLTNAVSWSSSATGTASVNPQGLVKALGAGTTQVSAAYKGVTSGNDTVTVTNATLTALKVSPAPVAPATSIVIAANTTQPFSAVGTFSDSSSQDLTQQVTWSSSQSGVATVNQSGLASGVSAGQTAIIATASNFGGLSGSQALTVNSADIVLTSISVSGPAKLAAGTSGQFKAVGQYSDGTSRDITTSVTWQSSDSGVASIASTGVAKAQVAGSTNITASFTPPGGTAVTKSIGLTVTSAYLTSISVVAAGGANSVTLPSGKPADTLQYSASGVFSDSTQQDLTADPNLSWVSSNPQVATIVSNPAPSGQTPGLATGATVGSTIISATYKNADNSTQTDSKSLTVNPASP